MASNRFAQNRLLQSDMTRLLPRFFALLLCGLAASPAQAQLEFEHDGLTRTYFMDAPDPIPAGAPIVLVLHGYTSSAQLIRAYSGWVPLALEEGFVAVFPQGTEDNFNINHWNANIGNSNTDDHGFLVALVQHLQQEHGLSTDCVYSCGMSNGGFMSYSLACEHPEVFSAIGSVTGAMSGADFGCTPSEVVPIVHLHGTADQTVAYDGGVGTPGWGGEGVPAIIDHWTGLMGTTTLEETALPNLESDDVTSVDFLRYAGSPGGQEFHHYRVNDGGHDWFGVWGSQDVEATQVLWDFFSAQCAGEFTGVDTPDALTPALIDPFGDGIRANAEVRISILDLQGRLMETLTLSAGEMWEPSSPGIRLIKAAAPGHQPQVLYWD